MMRFLYPVLVALALLLTGARAEESSRLTIEAFLASVKEKNPEVQGATQSAEGAKLRSEERGILLSPNLFAEASYAADGKLPQIALFNYDRIVNQNIQLGVSKLSSYGQQLRLFYQVTHTDFVNVRIPGGGGGAATAFYDARPVFEISQNLWSNGFGRSTRASLEALEFGAVATSHASQFQKKAALVAAEDAYWRLSFARERVAIQKVALEQAKKIYQWSAARAKNRLGDEADALQARAALEVRELEMQSAIDEEKMASRSFNKVRYAEGEVVSEELQPVVVEELLAVKTLKREEKRDDVKAAEAQTKAVVALNQVAQEKQLPTLDVSASLALNGRATQLGSVLGDSYKAGRPTYGVSVKFAMPLDRGTVSDVRRGLLQEEKAAELNLQHKLAQQERDWQELTRRLEEGKRRLSLSMKITQAQEAKLNHERTRLKQGRTTTFQVLLFEQDFAQAQLAQLRAEAEVVGTTTQMKLFGGSL